MEEWRSGGLFKGVGVRKMRGWGRRIVGRVAECRIGRRVRGDVLFSFGMPR